MAENLAAQINARLEGWVAAMSLHFTHASGDQVTAEFQLGPRHLQAYGIVHGGVYSGLIQSGRAGRSGVVGSELQPDGGRAGKSDAIHGGTLGCGPAVERKPPAHAISGRLCRLRLCLIDGNKLFRDKSFKGRRGCVPG
jgi:hypothetical protein